MDGEVGELIKLLDDDSGGSAEDAQWALIDRGPEIMEPLLEAVPRLGSFGQLCAIEIIEHFQDVRAADVLIGLLDSDNSTVREWAARALGGLGATGAISALHIGYERIKQAGTPPDHTEPASFRHALAQLGARTVVLPSRTASLLTTIAPSQKAWPASRLAEVIEDLAAHGQVILYFQVWVVSDRGWFWHKHEGLDWEFDPAMPWKQTVALARENALIEAACLPERDDLVATIEWIDQSDI